MPDPSPAPVPAAAPKPDAVLVPANYPKGVVGFDRHIAFKNEFGPLLGTGRVYAWHMMTSNETLLTPFGDPKRNHRYWPKDHPNAGQEFYDWKDRGDGTGVMLGYLTDEAKTYIKETEGA